MGSKNKTELYILKGFLKYIDFTAKFLDKANKDFFSPEIQPSILALKKYYNKYNKLPSIEQMCDNFLPQICKDDNLREMAEQAIQDAIAISFDQKDYEEHYEWLISETKEFILEKNIELALMESVELLQSGKKYDAVKRIIDANNMNFDEDIGVDYMGDLEKRINQLKEKKNVTSSGIKALDVLLNGGFYQKTLTIFGAGTNVGKTVILGAIAANLIQQGKNGLYITLEINDYALANRIDANIGDINVNDLTTNTEQLKNTLYNKYKDAEENGTPIGRLIIKEYPPATINAQTILALVRELEMKRGGFKPDFICVDYIGLMIPNGKGFSDNTYGKLKTVTEELRSIASILNICAFSAVQTNRESYKSEKVGLENTSDSMGIPMGADLMIMVTRNEELDIAKKMYWYIAKSRQSQNNVGLQVKVDFPKMRISDCDEYVVDNKKLAQAISLCDTIASEKKDPSKPSGFNSAFGDKKIKI